ncbi:MAG: hypothetical protein KC613_07020 [Myxococcales bacterium]|nr:hypothetical protein [Myxococcales bacterium]
MSPRRPLLAWLACAPLVGCSLIEDPELALRGVTVTDDAYADGRLNPGDQARVVVQVNNGGGEPESSLSCTVTGGGQGVQVDPRDDSLSFGYCSGACESSFRVTVDPGALVGQRVFFNCDLGDAGRLSIPLTVEAPDLRPEVGRITITDDATADGVLNPGEAATVSVELVNAGGAALSRSTCVVGSDTAGVEVLAADDDLIWNGCAPGAECGTSRFRVQVGPQVPPGTMIDWRCDLVDAAEAVYPLTFRRRVEASAARPRLVVTQVDDDGDDGALDPGEAATLGVLLLNDGLATLPRATCVVETGHGWAEVMASDDDLTWNGCAGDRECGTSRVRVRLEADAPVGEPATFACTLEDTLETRWPLEFAVIVGGGE